MLKARRIATEYTRNARGESTSRTRYEYDGRYYWLWDNGDVTEEDGDGVPPSHPAVTTIRRTQAGE